MQDLGSKDLFSVMVKHTYDVTKLGTHTSQLFLSLLYGAHLQLMHEVQSHTLQFVLWKVSGLSIIEKSFLF